MTRYRLLGAILAATALLGMSACDYTKRPKDSFVDRVSEWCGPKVAGAYAHTKWQDRDYAQDILIVSCILERTPIN